MKKIAKSRGRPENLKPFRSVDEAREKGKKGGIKSGQKRREKKTFKEIIEIALNSNVSEKEKNKYIKQGFFENEEDITQKHSITVALIEKAKKGDVYAYDRLFSSSNEQNESEERVIIKDDI